MKSLPKNKFLNNDDDDIVIDFKQFRELFRNQLVVEESVESMTKIFQILENKDHLGFISNDMLSELFLSSGDNVSQEEIEEIISILDPTKSGEVEMTALINLISTT